MKDNFEASRKVAAEIAHLEVLHRSIPAKISSLGESFAAQLVADCRHAYSIYHGKNRKLAEELEPGVWRQFDQVRPNRASEFGYLVVLPETRQPVLAQFDEESKRFMVFCPQIGKSIQVPVTKWFAIPDPNK